MCILMIFSYTLTLLKSMWNTLARFLLFCRNTNSSLSLPSANGLSPMWNTWDITIWVTASLLTAPKCKRCGIGPPLSLKQMFACANYYHCFIHKFSSLSTCLHNLVHDKVPNIVPWTHMHQIAFDALKHALSHDRSYAHTMATSNVQS